MQKNMEKLSATHAETFKKLHAQLAVYAGDARQREQDLATLRQLVLRLGRTLGSQIWTPSATLQRSSPTISNWEYHERDLSGHRMGAPG